MAFWGFEAQRDSLKYRCPAAARGFTCRGRAECEKMAPHGPTGTGRIVRVPLDFNRRIFTPIPPGHPHMEQAVCPAYAVERVNSRIDGCFGFERHTIRGIKKMRVRMGLALMVMLSMAVG